MATQTKKSNTKTKSNKIAKRASATRGPNPVMSQPVTEFNEKAAERVQQLREQAVASGKNAGAAYLLACEDAVLSGVDAYEKAAGGSKPEWVADIAKAQADFTRATTKAYGRAARELVS